MNRGQNWKCRQDNDRLKRDFPAPIGPDYFDGEKHRAERHDTQDHLGSAITADIVWMGKHLDGRHGEQGGKRGRGDQACQSPVAGHTGMRRHIEFGEAEQLGERNNRKNANERPG